MLPGCFGRRGGGRHPVTAVGDPNQAIYGWRGASVSNILRFPSTSRAPTARRRDLPAHRQPAVRPPDPRRRQRPGGAALRAHPQVEPLDARHGRRRGGAARRPRDARRGARAGSRRRSTHRAPGRPLVARSACSPRQRARRRGVRRAHRRRDAGRDRGPLRAAPAAGGRRGRRHAARSSTTWGPTPRSSPCYRTALGHRPARPRAARPAAGQLAGARPAATPRHRSDGRSPRAVAGADPAEIVPRPTRSTTRATCRTPPQALERFGMLAAELRRLRSHVGEPLIDWSGGSSTRGVDVELASPVSARRPPAARTSTCSSGRSPSSRPSTAESTLRVPAGLAHAEDEHGNGPRRRHPDRGRLREAADRPRAKGLEWTSVFLVGVCDTRFPANRSRGLWTAPRRCCPTPLRGDREGPAELLGHDKDGHGGAPRGHQGPRGRRSCGSATSRSPAPRTGWPSRRTAGARAPTPFGPSMYQQVVREALGEWGEPPRLAGRPVRSSPTRYAEDPLDARGPPPADGRGAASARGRRAGPAGRPAAEDDLTRRLAGVADWDAELERLLVEARSAAAVEIAVPCPCSLSAPR